MNSTFQSSNTPILQSPSSFRDPDEINLLEYIYALVKNKWWIIGVTFLGIILGYGAAKMKGPRWVAEVLIAPKEAESQKTPSFAGLGALGGLVASQLNMGGNASLDKIDLILDSREFNARFVESFNLTPHIYKDKWPKVYKKYWDPAQQNWKPEFVKPKFLEMGSIVKVTYLKKVLNKNNTMTVKIRSKDSTFTINYANNYISYLDKYIKSNVQNDAKENVMYLEKQLNNIADPLFREKIQELIANEIEKQMVVSKEAFRIIDQVYLYKEFKEKKLFPLIFGFGLFFLVCLILVFMQAISSADKTDEDKRLIEKIKAEIFFNRK
jgi:LPS O-antigen subunit length determinant protein (WzzB/FepE family)